MFLVKNDKMKNLLPLQNCTDTKFGPKTTLFNWKLTLVTLPLISKKSFFSEKFIKVFFYFIKRFELQIPITSCPDLWKIDILFERKEIYFFTKFRYYFLRKWKMDHEGKRSISNPKCFFWRLKLSFGVWIHEKILLPVERKFWLKLAFLLCLQ